MLATHSNRRAAFQFTISPVCQQQLYRISCHLSCSKGVWLGIHTWMNEHFSYSCQGGHSWEIWLEVCPPVVHWYNRQATTSDHTFTVKPNWKVELPFWQCLLSVQHQVEGGDVFRDWPHAKLSATLYILFQW